MLSRRDLLSGTATAASAAALSSAQSSSKPNFIVFVSDDHGSNDLGCQGATDVRTPNIDAIAKSGARFTNWYANAPMCAPSRAALLTGRYPIRCGVPSNGPDLPASEMTTAKLLKRAGYATGLIGKWHLGTTDQTCPNGHGFDTFYGFHSGCIDFYSHRFYWGGNNYPNYHDLWRNRTEIFEDGQYFTELITREVLAFLEANHSKPFFLYVPYNAVHYPMHAPQKYVERFPALEPERRMYAAMLSAMDDSIGAVMAKLKQFGVFDNTMVFFGGDNGATTENRAGLNGKPATAGVNKYRGYKFSLFDGGMHVPAMMSWPGKIPAGQVIDEVCSHIDLLPTICNAAGVPLPTDRTYDGHNILPVAAAKAKSPHKALFWASDKQVAVRQGNWKLVENGYDADGTPNGRKNLEGEDSVFLSDLASDPKETKNLRRLHPNVVDELLTAARQWRTDVAKP